MRTTTAALALAFCCASVARGALVGNASMSTGGTLLPPLVRAASLSAWVLVKDAAHTCMSVGSDSGVRVDVCVDACVVTASSHWLGHTHPYMHAQWPLACTEGAPPQWHHVAVLVPEQFNDTQHAPLLYVNGTRVPPTWVAQGDADDPSVHPPDPLPYPYTQSVAYVRQPGGGGGGGAAQSAVGALSIWLGHKAHMALESTAEGEGAPCAHPSVQWRAARSGHTCTLQAYGADLYTATLCSGDSIPDAAWAWGGGISALPPFLHNISMPGPTDARMCQEIASDCTGAFLGTYVYGATLSCGSVCYDASAGSLDHQMPHCFVVDPPPPPPPPPAPTGGGRERGGGGDGPRDESDPGATAAVAVGTVVSVVALVFLLGIGVYFGTNRCDRTLIRRRMHRMRHMGTYMGGRNGRSSKDRWVMVGDEAQDVDDMAEAGGAAVAAAATDGDDGTELSVLGAPPNDPLAEVTDDDGTGGGGASPRAGRTKMGSGAPVSVQGRSASTGTTVMGARLRNALSSVVRRNSASRSEPTEHDGSTEGVPASRAPAHVPSGATDGGASGGASDTAGAAEAAGGECADDTSGLALMPRTHPDV